MTIISLRPPTILGPGEYGFWADRRAAMSEVEDPCWNYGSWIDSRDTASAVAAALVADLAGHRSLLIAADDISSYRPGREVIDELYPRLEWRGGPEHDADPYAALVRSDHAKQLLGWKPEHLWKTWSDRNADD
jgi:nucleoside-diphosphate-sugar epimerase